jgi:DNA-binding response OmpR family regulator
MGESGSSPKQERAQTSSSVSPSDAGSAEKGCHILIVEDNKADVFLIREAIEAARVEAEVHVVSDGDKAIRFLCDADINEAAPCPVLVILDINLPKKHGAEVLQELRRTRRCSKAIVVVVTSSDSDQDRRRMAELGANAYFRKSSEYREFMKLGSLVRVLLSPASPSETSRQ